MYEKAAIKIRLELGQSLPHNCHEDGFYKMFIIIPDSVKKGGMEVSMISVCALEQMIQTGSILIYDLNHFIFSEMNRVSSCSSSS